ncbi:type II toxin-antitoxin system HicA family toxin [Comamonas sp. NLF-1-9]|uniref:type II toxin-antitoxin system HicA family toxin n=1 Tax=Comamonas sp. NLF-1-9 TaxID=2853163 RepID=UPI001C46400F|nr:type II toxin-antitoxin system HicA family toxin [Comamonas sp. NLF-1-9]
MPELPHVSGTQAVRALERLGFSVARRRGSHIVLRRGASGCVVPNHRELKVGTLAGALKQAGVTAEEFMNALRRKI